MSCVRAALLRTHFLRTAEPSSLSFQKRFLASKIFNGQLIRPDRKQNPQSTTENGELSVLHISASHGPSSLVSSASSHLISNLRFPHSVTGRDLWAEAEKSGLISYNVSHVAAKMRLLKGKGSEEDEEKFRPVLEIAEELNKAKILIISTPMWNFSFPYVIKQYIDIALQPGINFIESPSGGAPVPASTDTDKVLIVISSCGGTYKENDGKPADHLAPYLKDMFRIVGFRSAVEIPIQGASQRPRAELESFARLKAEEVAGMLNEQFER